MAFVDIDGALIQAYINLGLGLPTAYEGQEFDPPNDFSDWAQVRSLPAGTEVASLGVNGIDRHTGILDIQFATAPGKGTSALLGYAEAIRNEFVAGKDYTLNGQVVKSEGVDRSQIIEVDGWLRITASVKWVADTIRPII